VCPGTHRYPRVMAPVPVHASQEDKQFRYQHPGWCFVSSRVVPSPCKSPPFRTRKHTLGEEHWGISLLWRGKQAILADTSRSRSTPYVGKAIAGLLLPFQMGLVRGVANPHGGLTKLCLFLHCTLEFWVPAGFNARDWSAHSKIR